MDKQNTSIEKAQTDFKNSQIFVTEKAAKRLKAVMSAEGKDNHFLRMSVDSGGCSGMNYKMDFEDSQGSYDKEFETNGLKVVCDLKSWLYLKNRKPKRRTYLWLWDFFFCLELILTFYKTNE